MIHDGDHFTAPGVDGRAAGPVESPGRCRGPPAHDLVVLFTYYRDDLVTRAHHELHRHNPGVPVIPQHARPAFITGTVDVAAELVRWVGPCGPRLVGYRHDRLPLVPGPLVEAA